MTPRSILTTVGSFLFCAFLQFAGSLAPLQWTIVAGGLSSFIFLALLHFFEVELPLNTLRLVLPATLSVAGVAAGWAGGNANPMIWWAPASAAAVAALWWIVSNGLGNLCHLCNRWLRRSVVAFECPRCGFQVCEQCWEFEHLRCRLCQQNLVPIFPSDGRWWDRCLGARVNYGRCQICLTTSDQADLRSCGRCGRTQCRPCWDYANGQCSRCSWIVDDLPARLRPYMLKTNTTLTIEN